MKKMLLRVVGHSWLQWRSALPLEKGQRAAAAVPLLLLGLMALLLWHIMKCNNTAGAIRALLTVSAESLKGLMATRHAVKMNPELAFLFHTAITQYNNQLI